MMRLESTFTQLDAAVKRSDITILRGLPRVGRSSFLRDWNKRRTDTIGCDKVEEVKLEPGIFIVDHVNAQAIDQIIDIAREAEAAKSRTRLIIAPIDLVAAERLRTTLPGVVSSVEITPLRVDELTIEFDQQVAAGPVRAAPLATTSASAFPASDPNRHWLRGGLPDSLLSPCDQDSLTWRCGLLEGLLARDYTCLLYTSPSPRDQRGSRMPSSA